VFITDRKKDVVFDQGLQRFLSNRLMLLRKHTIGKMCRFTHENVQKFLGQSRHRLNFSARPPSSFEWYFYARHITSRRRLRTLSKTMRVWLWQAVCIGTVCDIAASFWK